MAKTVLIGVDNSKECLKAVDFALEHFPGYNFHLVHVQPHTVPASSMAHVETNPDHHIVFDGQGGKLASAPYDTETKLDKEQTASSEHFLNQVFTPKISSTGAQVHATLLHIGGDSSRVVGSALCNYAAKVKATVLVTMKESKSAVHNFFLGSVSSYCAIHCSIPVLIVPP